MTMKLVLVGAAVMAMGTACEKPKGFIPRGNEPAAPERVAPVQPEAKAAAVRPPVALGIHAEELLAAYSKNELAGDLAYKGKRIRVNGFVKEVSVVMGAPAISLGDRTGRVMCFFPKNLDQPHLEEMSRLKKGDLLNLDGDCRGAGAMGGVVLADCFYPGNDRVGRETPELLMRR